MEEKNLTGHIYSNMCPPLTGNPAIANKIKILGKQMCDCNKTTFTMKNVVAQMMPENIVDLSDSPAEPSDSCVKLATIIRQYALPKCASPVSLKTNSFVVGFLGSGFTIRLENKGEVFFLCIDLSSAKKWVLMETENPFLIVKFIVSLREMIDNIDNYGKFRQFLVENK